MRRAFPFLVYSLALLLALTAAGCKRATEAAPAPAEAAMPPFIPDHTIKDLMLNVVDTNADVVWLSVTTTASEKGLVETRPKNDAEWMRVRQGAVTLAEAANLLQIRLFDHVILGTADNGRQPWFSFREAGIL